MYVEAPVGPRFPFFFPIERFDLYLHLRPHPKIKGYVAYQYGYCKLEPDDIQQNMSITEGLDGMPRLFLTKGLGGRHCLSGGCSRRAVSGIFY